MSIDKPGTATPAPRATSARSNRIVLLLNLGLLAVNLLLAVEAGGARTRPADASPAGGVRVAGEGEPPGVALSYSRVLQTLDAVAPGPEPLFTADKLAAVHDAVRRYRAAIDAGVKRLLRASGDRDLRAAYAELGRDARAEVEIALGRSFSDAALVERLATEVIRGCR